MRGAARSSRVVGIYQRSYTQIHRRVAITLLPTGFLGFDKIVGGRVVSVLQRPVRTCASRRIPLNNAINSDSVYPAFLPENPINRIRIVFLEDLEIVSHRIADFRAITSIINNKNCKYIARSRKREGKGKRKNLRIWKEKSLRIRIIVSRNN